jgi:hypothetical protein
MDYNGFRQSYSRPIIEHRRAPHEATRNNRRAQAIYLRLGFVLIREAISFLTYLTVVYTSLVLIDSSAVAISKATCSTLKTAKEPGRVLVVIPQGEPPAQNFSAGGSCFYLAYWTAHLLSKRMNPRKQPIF